jgi:hypothetical protein
MRTDNLKNFITLNVASVTGYINFALCLYFHYIYRHLSAQADKQNFSFNLICVTMFFVVIHLFLFLSWVLEKDIKKHHIKNFDCFIPLSLNKIYSILFYTGLVLNISLYVKSSLFFYLLLNIQVTLANIIHDFKYLFISLKQLF